MGESLYRFELHNGFVVPIVGINAEEVALATDGHQVVDLDQAHAESGFSVESLCDLHEHFNRRLLPAPSPEELAAAPHGDADLRKRYGHLLPEFYRQFIQLCRSGGIDPWTEGLNPEVQYDARIERRKLVLIVSIGLLRSMGASHPRYKSQRGPLFLRADGTWTDAWISKEPPAACKVGIVLQDDTEPLWAVATWSSYAPYVQTERGQVLNPLWADKADIQIASVAEAMGYRRAFGGIFARIYCSAEMAQRGNPRRAVESRPVTQRPLDDDRQIVLTDEYSQV